MLIFRIDLFSRCFCFSIQRFSGYSPHKSRAYENGSMKGRFLLRKMQLTHPSDDMDQTTSEVSLGEVDNAVSPISKAAHSFIDDTTSHELSEIRGEHLHEDFISGDVFQKYSERFSRRKTRHLELTADKKQLQVIPRF